MKTKHTLKLKTMCLFCGEDHRGRAPKFCKAKCEIMRGYLAKVAKRDAWTVFYAVDNKIIDLDGEASRLLAKRKTKRS